jgi:hypothetical protein
VPATKDSGQSPRGADQIRIEVLYVIPPTISRAEAAGRVAASITEAVSEVDGDVVALTIDGKIA